MSYSCGTTSKTLAFMGMIDFLLCEYNTSGWSGGGGNICACLYFIVSKGKCDWCSINVMSTLSLSGQPLPPVVADAEEHS